MRSPVIDLREIERVYVDLMRGTQQVTDEEIERAKRLWRESVDPRYQALLDARERVSEVTETANG